MSLWSHQRTLRDLSAMSGLLPDSGFRRAWQRDYGASARTADRDIAAVMW